MCDTELLRRDVVEDRGGADTIFPHGHPQPIKIFLSKAFFECSEKFVKNIGTLRSLETHFLCNYLAHTRRQERGMIQNT